MPRLHLVSELLATLNSSAVPYCHWKSNFNLERSFLGQADLDLLVDPAFRSPFEERVRELEFVRLVHVGPKRTPGLEDYLGFDESTGTLVHLHVHYELVLGEQRVKNHRLPIERWLLGRSVLRDGIKVPLPEDELFLLYVRSIAKSDLRACLRSWLRRGVHPFPRAIQAELLWLAQQTTDAAVVLSCRDSGLGALANGLGEFLVRLRTARLTPAFVVAEKRRLLRTLRPYRRFPGVVCLARKVWFRARYSRLARFAHPLPKKRLAGSGVFAAVTGADGSGKTTLARDLSRWLGWKLQSSSIYFGQPKGSVIVSALRKGRKAMLTSSARLERLGARPISALFRGLGNLLNSLLWVYLARLRVRMNAEARARSSVGQVVFAERFPVPGFWTMETPMDGPRLRKSANGRLLRALASHEQTLYEQIPAPDCVVVLQANLATLRERKPDTPADEHRAKVRAVAALVERGEHEVIDAEQSYSDVLLDAKRRIWRLLSPTTMNGSTGHGAPRRSATARAFV
jgi:hypothetical protein